ncbi:MAG: FAD:protein FMN transferase [Solirubrobacteraceae bacterium]
MSTTAQRPATRPGLASWEALGTTAVLVLADERVLACAREVVEQELARIDRACSRFRADSELCRLNAHAGEWVQVDPLLFEATELGVRAARITDGNVDPTLGFALELAGYDRDWRLLEPPSTEEEGMGVCKPRVRAAATPGWRAVRLDRARRAVRLPHGVKLDLGATAKAWAADRASRAVHDATGVGVLVSLGGDLSACGDAPLGGWRVHVTDDHRAPASAPGQRIAIQGGGLATSSVAVRRWRHEGHTMHHIIDPASGAPASGPWRTVSVAAVDCADANIASTAALVRGESALEWLDSLELPARLVRHDGTVATVGSWPTEEARSLAA